MSAIPKQWLHAWRKAASVSKLQKRSRKKAAPVLEHLEERVVPDGTNTQQTVQAAIVGLPPLGHSAESAPVTVTAAVTGMKGSLQYSCRANARDSVTHWNHSSYGFRISNRLYLQPLAGQGVMDFDAFALSTAGCC
jgi:hypothetical protein